MSTGGANRGPETPTDVEVVAEAGIHADNADVAALAHGVNELVDDRRGVRLHHQRHLDLQYDC